MGNGNYRVDRLIRGLEVNFLERIYPTDFLWMQPAYEIQHCWTFQTILSILIMSCSDQNPKCWPSSGRFEPLIGLLTRIATPLPPTRQYPHKKVFIPTEITLDSLEKHRREAIKPLDGVFDKVHKLLDE